MNSLFKNKQLKSFLLDDLEKAANDIARKAIELAFDPDYQSPFALAARQNGININGLFYILLKENFYYIIL